MVSSIQLASAAVRLTLSVVTAAAQHYTKRQHDEHENNEINRLDQLSNTSHRRHCHAAYIIGGR